MIGFSAPRPGTSRGSVGLGVGIGADAEQLQGPFHWYRRTYRFCTMTVEERLGELEIENGAYAVWEGNSPKDRLYGSVIDRSMEELRWQSMDPEFLLSETIVEAEVVELDALKALRSAILRSAIAAGAAFKQQQRARRAAAIAVGSGLKATKSRRSSASGIPGCYSDRATARTWASKVMKRTA